MPVVLSLAAALLVLAPVLGGGVVLAFDMVFVPHQPLRPDSVGLGTALPRSVPVDAVVALATSVLPGQWLQDLVLVGLLVGAGAGAARLVPTESLPARCAAALVYVWNPYVAERLLLGHWVLLVGYAALPWVLHGALSVRREAPGGAARTLLAVAVASLTPTGGLLAAGVALAGAGRRGLRPALLGGVALLQLPWLVPALLHPAATTSDAAGVAAFAARSENWAGVPGAVLGLGGLWNAQAVPGSRTSAVAPLLSLALLALAAAGLPALVRRWGRPAARAVLVLAAAGLLAAVAGATPLLDDVVRWLVATVPGGGLLRDGQKWLAPLALVLAVGAGLGTERLAASRWRVASGLALVLPLAVVPDLAWGAGGSLRAVDYPADWTTVQRLLDGDDRGGAVVSLPFSAYRAYAWNGGRTSLDPAPRWFDREVVVDDRLQVGAVLLDGEDRRAAQVRTALGAGTPLGDLGVGWLLVQHSTPGAVPAALLDGAEQVHAGTDLSLWRVPDVRDVSPERPPAAPVLAADVVALAVVGAAAAVALRSRREEGG